MKKIHRPFFVVSIILVIAALFVCTAFAFSRADDILKQFSNLSEAESTEMLKDKDFHALIDEVNVLSERVDMSDLIFHADALREKATHLSPEKITKEILNPDNSTAVKVILLQISRSVGDDGFAENLIPLLSQDSVDFEVKRNVLLNMFSMKPDADLLEKISLGEDDRLAFHSLKMLNDVDPERAATISDSVIKEYDGKMTDVVRAALKVKASHIAKNQSDENRTDTIAFCVGLLEQNTLVDEVARDTIIFALSDMMKEESISYIVKSTKIDNVAKGYCIDQNFSVLQEMIKNDPTVERVELVLEAMKIFPITDMIEPLQSLSDSSFSGLKTSAKTMILNNINDSITFIRENGMNATNKYEIIK